MSKFYKVVLLSAIFFCVIYSLNLYVDVHTPRTYEHILFANDGSFLYGSADWYEITDRNQFADVHAIINGITGLFANTDIIIALQWALYFGTLYWLLITEGASDSIVWIIILLGSSGLFFGSLVQIDDAAWAGILIMVAYRYREKSVIQFLAGIITPFFSVHGYLLLLVLLVVGLIKKTWQQFLAMAAGISIAILFHPSSKMLLKETYARSYFIIGSINLSIANITTYSFLKIFLPFLAVLVWFVYSNIHTTSKKVQPLRASGFLAFLFAILGLMHYRFLIVAIPFIVVWFSTTVQLPQKKYWLVPLMIILFIGNSLSILKALDKLGESELSGAFEYLEKNDPSAVLFEPEGTSVVFRMHLPDISFVADNDILRLERIPTEQAKKYLGVRGFTYSIQETTSILRELGVDYIVLVDRSPLVYKLMVKNEPGVQLQYEDEYVSIYEVLP